MLTGSPSVLKTRMARLCPRFATWWRRESKPKNFEISKGARIWEQEFGVPTEGAAPEPRKYALQQANYLKRMMLYARITDLNENKVYKVFPIGPLLSFSKPEAQIDRASNL